MVKHVSMFILNADSPEADRKAMQAYLEAMPETEPAIIYNEIGTRLALMLPMPADSEGEMPIPADGGPKFYDLIQIIGFATAEEAAAYPLCRGHQELIAKYGHCVESVAAIDYAC